MVGVGLAALLAFFAAAAARPPAEARRPTPTCPRSQPEPWRVGSTAWRTVRRCVAVGRCPVTRGIVPTTAVSLADLTTLRVGGPVRRYVTAPTTDAVIDAVRECDSTGEPLLVLGGGSNLLVGDDGFDGTVVHVQTRGLQLEARAPAAVPASGWRRGRAGTAWWSRRSSGSGSGSRRCPASPARSVQPRSRTSAPTGRRSPPRSRPSAPGTASRTGSAPWPRPTASSPTGTAGSRRRLPRRAPVRRPRGHLPVAARAPVGADPLRGAGPSARHRGRPAGPAGGRPGRVLALRAGKGMVLDGPTRHLERRFVLHQPGAARRRAEPLPAEAPRWPVDGGLVKTSAAWLIEHAGYGRGFNLPGPAAVSRKHSLALTNRGGAKAADLVELARKVRDGACRRIRDRTGPRAGPGRRQPLTGLSPRPAATPATRPPRPASAAGTPRGPG